MARDEQTELLNEVLLGHQAAIQFCESLFDISQVWDDIIDCDNDFTDKDVNRAFWEALVTIPNNPFYQHNFDILNPLVQASIVDWLDSNELCKGNEEHKCAAYVLRDTLSTIVIHCARIVGGYEHMRNISLKVREWLYSEPIEMFMEEHDGQRQQT